MKGIETTSPVFTPPEVVPHRLGVEASVGRDEAPQVVRRVGVRPPRQATRGGRPGEARLGPDEDGHEVVARHGHARGTDRYDAPAPRLDRGLAAWGAELDDLGDGNRLGAREADAGVLDALARRHDGAGRSHHGSEHVVEGDHGADRAGDLANVGERDRVALAVPAGREVHVKGEGGAEAEVGGVGAERRREALGPAEAW